MHLPLPFLLVIAALLGAWLSWLAVRRADRRRLLWRLLASWAVVSCLVLLLSPPTFTQSYNASEAVLLTEGYRSDTLQALVKKLKPRPQIYAFGVEANRAEKILDLATFQQQQPAVKTLHVLGHGLPAEELSALRSIRLVPHLSTLPTGVLATSWTQEITLGEELLVQGTFQGSAEEKTTLFLQAAGKARDFVEVTQGARQTFSLRFTPKAAGRFVYAVRWQDASDSVHQEAVPVTVLAPRQLSVLLLSSAPSFEGKFLKNALAEKGHSVAYRAQVSKGTYATETVNLPSLNLNRLTPALLQKFDVALLDDATLQGLGAGERQALQQAVRQQGLGVLTSVSAKVPKPLTFFTEGVFRNISDKPTRNGILRWAKQTGTNAVLPVSNTILQPREGQQALVWEQNPNNSLVVRYRKGVGQVGISLVPETFPWVLEGKETLYQQYWATVLTALAKQEEKTLVMAPYRNLAPFQVFHPVMLAVSSSSPDASLSLIADSSGKTVEAYSYPSAQLPTQQIATVWPQASGWYSSSEETGTKSSFYVHPKNAWRTQKLHLQQQALQKAALASIPTVASGALEKEEELPLWIFGTVLVLALGFLWLEEKL